MRPRLTDRHLPACVYLKSGSYYLVKRGKWTRLGGDLTAALKAYAQFVDTPSGGMGELIRMAMPSITLHVAENTRKQYDLVARKLINIFQEFAPHQVLPKHIAQMRRELAVTPNMTNRMLSVLRMVFDYAVEEQLVDGNPCIGIKRLAEGKRDRLLSPREYEAIHAVAPPRLQIVMDLLRLTGQRVTDVLRIRYADLSEEGIAFKQQKTGAKLVVRWSPELREVTERARLLDDHIRALTLLHGRGGKPVDYRSTHDQWVTACAKAKVEDADLRDLRPMAATAAKLQGVDPTALLGHTSPAMTKRYLRNKEAPLVSGPSFRKTP